MPKLSKSDEEVRVAVIEASSSDAEAASVLGIEPATVKRFRLNHDGAEYRKSVAEGASSDWRRTTRRAYVCSSCGKGANDGSSAFFETVTYANADSSLRVATRRTGNMYCPGCVNGRAEVAREALKSSSGARASAETTSAWVLANVRLECPRCRTNYDVPDLRREAPTNLGGGKKPTSGKTVRVLLSCKKCGSQSRGYTNELVGRNEREKLVLPTGQVVWTRTQLFMLELDGLLPVGKRSFKASLPVEAGLYAAKRELASCLSLGLVETLGRAARLVTPSGEWVIAEARKRYGVESNVETTAS